MDWRAATASTNPLVNKITPQRPTVSGNTLRVQRITQKETNKIGSQVEIGKQWKIVEGDNQSGRWL